MIVKSIAWMTKNENSNYQIRQPLSNNIYIEFEIFIHLFLLFIIIISITDMLCNLRFLELLFLVWTKIYLYISLQFC